MSPPFSIPFEKGILCVKFLPITGPIPAYLLLFIGQSCEFIKIYMYICG